MSRDHSGEIGRIWYARLRKRGARRFFQVTEHKTEAQALIRLGKEMARRDAFHGNVAFSDPWYEPHTTIDIYRRP